MPSLPVSLKHIRRMTDDTGIAEHALGIIPRRKEGYSTDDQARALWACLAWLDVAEGDEKEELHRLIDTYLSFMLWVQREDGHFHNNIAFDRTPEDETPSDDCLGRCIWASALTLTTLQDEDRKLAAKQMLEKALPLAEEMAFPRGRAYALAAVSLLLRSGCPFDFDLREAAERWADRLIGSYRTHARPETGWHWYEPALTYSNGVLPWGLLSAYEATGRPELLDVAEQSLRFLIRLSADEEGRIRPVGNRGWCTPGHRAMWDQQPIDVMKLMLAVSKAYEITRDKDYADVAKRCRNWFHGDNDAGMPIADVKEGAACDGLEENGLNRNKGAEATIAYLLTESLYHSLVGTT
ncbi:glycosyl transferase [Paenibacillus thailandensis]|uniref:Glycosyl transferase n=1 Tax=Paenibacillus thailandensis TaxID=393250 RepID=A0ABW5QVT7_9BACL